MSEGAEVAGEVPEVLPARVEFRSTYGPAATWAVWFASWGALYYWNRWELNVLLAFGMPIANTRFGLPRQTTIRIALATLVVAAVAALAAGRGSPHAQLAAVIAFGFAAILPFLQIAAGGAKLVLDSDGAAVFDWWIVRKVRWTDAKLELGSDPSGKPHSITLKVDRGIDGSQRRGWFSDDKDLHLQDHYGLAKTDLFTLMSRFRERAVGAV